jgi:hypothetical protein
MQGLMAAKAAGERVHTQAPLLLLLPLLPLLPPLPAAAA